MSQDGRIARTFAACRQARRSALVGYLTAFDPDRDRSLERILAACEAGLDVLELGVPFSDPTADGPVVQGAMVRALRAGATLAGTLALAAEIRARFELPIVLFSYANPLLRHEAASVCAEAKAAGIDALLVVDLPPEHAGALRDPALQAGLDWIGLVAPTTPPSRIDRVAATSSGFVYAVTLRGVTGSALDAARPELESQLSAIRARTELPVAAGFGVRTPEQAATLGRHADGVVVGSALIDAAQGSEADLRELVGSLRKALEA
jgi:tryptophan synthase alpha chain